MLPFACLGQSFDRIERGSIEGKTSRTANIVSLYLCNDRALLKQAYDKLHGATKKYCVKCRGGRARFATRCIHPLPTQPDDSVIAIDTVSR